jgi:hypothetical protein
VGRVLRPGVRQQFTFWNESQTRFACVSRFSTNSPAADSAGEEEPTMAIIAKAGGSFVPVPAGTHAAVCCDVIDHGLVEITFSGKTQKKHKITIAWQIDELMDTGKPFLVRRRYTLSLHEKATLRRDLESWRGKAFSDKELEGFDLESLLSVACLINVIHENRNGSVFANVASVMRLPKNMVAPTVKDYLRICDRPQTDGANDDLGISDDDVPF